MSIRRRHAGDIDEMPPAKLYLDEIQQIVDILTETSSAQADSPTVKFRLDDIEWDSLEDLKKVGGRRRRLEIVVTKGTWRESSLQLRRGSTFLSLSVPKDEFWSKQGRIKHIFESNAIFWKNLLNKLLDRAAVWIVIFFLLDVVWEVLVHFTPLRSLGTAERIMIFQLSLLSMLVCLFVYSFAFSGSVAVLHYSHEKGWRNWLRDHGSQILLIIVGVVLTKIADWIWHHFSH